MDSESPIEKISINETARYRSFTAEYSRLGSSYMFSHILPESGLVEALAPTLNFNGLMMVLVIEGNMSLSINLEECHVGRGTLLLFSPNSVVNTSNIKAEGVEAYLLFISPDFFKGLSLDLNVLSSVPFNGTRPPVIQLTDDEVLIMRKQMELIDLNTRLNDAPTDEPYMRSIARNHLGSVLYQLMMMVSRRNVGMREADDSSPKSRRLVYTGQFLELLHANFQRERSVAFYARRLFISPKYLSLVVKEMTGHSATELIDSFVIMEAKNQLRFSGKNIQQVAYDLNFSNQSAFGKYFKRITGQSPSEFQHS